MAELVRARRLSDDEGQRLQQIVRRGKHGTIRVRRALIIMASASGTPVPAIARLVAAHEDTVRDVIHAFNDIGLRALDPRWAGGRPRLISDDDVAFIVETATTRPKRLGRPFTRWSLRKLVDHLADDPTRRVVIGRERLRQLLRQHGVSLQRTRTWKESKDPDKEAKLDRIEEVTTQFPSRCFAFDQFGPLSIRPHHGAGWASEKHPDRLRATYSRTHGIRYFHGCYSFADALGCAAPTQRRRSHPDRTEVDPCGPPRRRADPRHPGQPVGQQDPHDPGMGGAQQGRVVPDPDQRLLGNSIEAQFGPLRTFTMANSDYPNHTVLARDLHVYLRWRNANARHPDVLAAQRRERARIRSERQQRWGRPKTKAA